MAGLFLFSKTGQAQSISTKNNENEKKGIQEGKT